MKPARLLVVDDDATAREGLREFLVEEGFDVQTAADGLEALDAMREFAPALLITDLDMPRFDGRALVDTVRERDMPMRVVVVSAHVPSERLRVDAHLTKPVELDALLRHVHALV
jgi:two-component system response regulator HydG